MSGCGRTSSKPVKFANHQTESEECHGLRRNKSSSGRPDCEELLSTGAMVGRSRMPVSLRKLLQRCLRFGFGDAIRPSDQSVRVTGPNCLPASGPTPRIDGHVVFFEARREWLLVVADADTRQGMRRFTRVTTRRVPRHTRKDASLQRFVGEHMKEDRKLSFPCQMPLPSALKFAGARKPLCPPNQPVKLPERMFLPRPATYPES